MILQKAHVPLEVDTRPLLNHLISGLTQFLGDHVEKGTVSSVGNYIVTGLSSHLLKGAKVRFFEASRSADTLIQPHSHRYCLFSLVIRGRVTHTLYRRTKNQDTAEGEDFAVRKIEFVGEDADGQYKVQDLNHAEVEYATFYRHQVTYDVGHSYYLSSDDIHSVIFEPGTILLILEGSEIKDSSVILEPVTNYESTTLTKALFREVREDCGDPNETREAEDTFRVQNHMFKRIYNE